MGRLGVESLLKSALSKLTGDLAGTYYPLTGMDEKVRQQLVDDHFLFVSGDRNLIVSNLRRRKTLEITFTLPGCRYGARLARGPWNLPQRGQDLPPVGERGGPDEDHLHGEGRRRQGSLLPSLSWYQGCGRLRQGRIRQGLCPLRAVRIHPLLPHQPWHRHEGFRHDRPARIHQGGHRCPQEEVRGARSPAPWNPWRIWWL